MAYLRAWVNSDGRQPPEMGPVTHLENDFASGRRFVEVLHREKVPREIEACEFHSVRIVHC